MDTMDTYDLNAFDMNCFSLKGKNAVITGANNGVGMGYAYALMKAGANVMIPCLNDNHWDTLRAAAADCGVEADFLLGRQFPGPGGDWNVGAIRQYRYPDQ